MAKKNPADTSHPDDQAVHACRALASQNNVPFEHVEGLARAMAANAGGGRDWAGFAKFILSILGGLQGLGIFGGAGGAPTAPPTPPA